jgi:hypothetical protein
MERRSDEERQAGREVRRAAVREVEEFLGPYRRTRPRKAEKAVLLRLAGTPETLVGPIEGEPQPAVQPRSSNPA